MGLGRPRLTTRTKRFPGTGTERCGTDQSLASWWPHEYCIPAQTSLPSVLRPSRDRLRELLARLEALCTAAFDAESPTINSRLPSSALNVKTSPRSKAGSAHGIGLFDLAAAANGSNGYASQSLSASRVASDGASV